MTWPPYGSKEPLYVRDPRPLRTPPPRVLPDQQLDAAYFITEDAEGALVVVEAESMLITGVFRRDMLDFAEEMRDRLIVRRLAKIANLSRCGVCQLPAISRRIPLGGTVIVYTHEDGTEHERGLA
jgi:hypothetical protein